MKEYKIESVKEFKQKCLPKNEKIKLNGHEVIILENSKDYDKPIYFGMIIDNECHEMEFGLKILGIKRYTVRINNDLNIIKMLEGIGGASFQELEYVMDAGDGFQVLLNAYRTFNYIDRYRKIYENPIVIEIYLQKITEINKDNSNIDARVCYINPKEPIIMLPYDYLFFDDEISDKDYHRLMDIFIDISMIFNTNITFEAEGKPYMYIEEGELRAIPLEELASCGLEKGLCESGKCDDKECQYNIDNGIMK